MMRARRMAMIALAAIPVASCDYARLLRPSVIKQLNPRVVYLVNELPATDQVNEELLGRLYAAFDTRTGSLLWQHQTVAAFTEIR